MTDPTVVTWGLICKLETAELLPDPEADAFSEAAEAEIGTDGLLSGWAIVAALLRMGLIDEMDLHIAPIRLARASGSTTTPT